MFRAAIASFLVLLMYIEVHQCDINTSSASMEAIVSPSGSLNCSGKWYWWACVNHPEEEKLGVMSLYLENNNIDNINAFSLQGFDNLQQLYLNNNNITSIKKPTFANLKNVEYMYLEHNSLKVIEPEAFKNLKKLAFIDFEDNQLTSIASGTFVNCINLWQVCLSKNSIKEIQEDSFRENSTLRHFRCAKNKISNLNFLNNLRNLAYLDLSYNCIKDVPMHTLMHMKDLLQLDLSHNKLETFNSGVFSELQALVKLNLSHNRLRYLGEGAFNRLYKLKYLYLQNNFLKDFSYRIGFEQRNNARLTVYIEDNRWSCSFIHNLLQLKLELIYEIRRNVTNVDGIACIDQLMYSKEATTATKQPERSFTIAPSTTTSTSTTTLSTIQTTASIKITTSPIVTKTTTTAGTTRNTTVEKLKIMDAPDETASETTTEESVGYVIVPKIEIKQSVVIMSIFGITLLVIVIITLSIRFTGRSSQNCSNSHVSEYELTKDGYMRPRPTPQRNSNFYITLEAYNQYEEVNLTELEHVYEVIE